MEDRVPHGCFNVGAKVFIEAGAWATVVTPNFLSFANFKVVDELLFVFVCLVGNHGRSPVGLFGACLLVLTNA